MREGLFTLSAGFPSGKWGCGQSCAGWTRHMGGSARMFLGCTIHTHELPTPVPTPLAPCPALTLHLSAPLLLLSPLLVSYKVEQQGLLFLRSRLLLQQLKNSPQGLLHMVKTSFSLQGICHHASHADTKGTQPSCFLKPISKHRIDSQMNSQDPPFLLSLTFQISRYL